MRRFNSDQIVVPMPLAQGLALRVVAEHMGLSTASLVRMLIRRGIDVVPTVKEVYDPKYAELSKLNDLQLLQAKSGPLPQIKPNHIS
jgi:hypothetical protein